MIAINDIKNYSDFKKLPILVNLVTEFVKGDMTSFWFPIGPERGADLGWNSIIIYDNTCNNIIFDSVKTASTNIIEYAKTLKGLDRITLNFLNPFCLMPIHVDTEDKPEYDLSNHHYNIITSITSLGLSIIGNTAISNKAGESIVFDGQVPHGAMNDTFDTRITMYLLIKKEEFIDDSAE